jgi:hypothetical protein
MEENAVLEGTEQQPYRDAHLEPSSDAYRGPFERRRCEHTLTGGSRCRRWADRDAKMCHAHRIYAESYGLPRIEVPLLEDEASILHVLSQTAQALARAAMPPANGLAVIGACRMATRVLDLQLRKAKFAASQKQAGPEKRPAPMPQPEVQGAEAGILCEAAAECDWLEYEECGAPEPAASELEAPEVHESEFDEALDLPAVDVFKEARRAAEAKTAAEKAAREAREGPTVDLPRFCPDDLEKEWDRGLSQPLAKNHKNLHLSKEESQRILAWQRRHPAEMKAMEQRMLDVYFGRAKSSPDDRWMRR